MNYFLIFLGLGALALYEASKENNAGGPKVDQAKFDDKDVIDLSGIPKAVFDPSIISIAIPGIPAAKDTWSASAIECMYLSGPGNRVYKCFFVYNGENRGAGLIEKVTNGVGIVVSVIEMDGAYADKVHAGDKLELKIPVGTKDCI